MSDPSTETESAVRPGEAPIVLPGTTDAGVYFIGTIRTPWRRRADCPKRGSPDGPVCSIVVDERWRDALTDVAQHRRIQVLYDASRSPRPSSADPVSHGTSHRQLRAALAGTPNPIASSVVELVAIEGSTLQVRGLDCLDGTPLIDLSRIVPSGAVEAAQTGHGIAI